jgi:hypothetical protein
LTTLKTPVPGSPVLGEILALPLRSNASSGADVFTPTLPELLILNTVGVKLPSRNLKSILEPLVLCCIMPVSPSIPKLN